DESGGAETEPDIIDPLQGLIDPFFGHGTFIAGLIHQTCPDANIVSIKMMGTDGIVDEAALLNGLGYLHQRHVDARAAGEAGVDDLIDIVSRGPPAQRRRTQPRPQRGPVQQRRRLDLLSRPGAALVSTMPTVDVGLRASVDLGSGPLDQRAVASWRASIDPAVDPPTRTRNMLARLGFTMSSA
ncbi:MAG TPA: hypothetical protein VGW74_21025, partial [Propionibacteriaceae bacterium]|nr:hypothetical protein [Propionibacteriaceae bacterium]